jgi:glycosyltransferase involved in cell wall biosynthesis
MAAQKPVIAYRSGGIPEIIVDGETGYLVPKGDIDLLAERIVQLAADPKLGAAIGLAGRERAQKEFTWQIAANRLDAIYAACLAGKRKGAP